MRNFQNFGGVFAIALCLAGFGVACGEDSSSSSGGQATRANPPPRHHCFFHLNQISGSRDRGFSALLGQDLDLHRP